MDDKMNISLSPDSVHFDVRLGFMIKGEGVRNPTISAQYTYTTTRTTT